jgi:hypothetical protein
MFQRLKELLEKWGFGLISTGLEGGWYRIVNGEQVEACDGFGYEVYMEDVGFNIHEDSFHLLVQGIESGQVLKPQIEFEQWGRLLYDSNYLGS